MSTTTFKAMNNETFTVQKFHGFVGIDLADNDRTNRREITSNVESETAVKLAEAILAAAGGAPKPDIDDEAAFNELVNRLEAALKQTTEGSALRQVIAGLALGFAIDQSDEAKAVVRALVGA